MQSHFPRKPFPIYGLQLLVLMQTAFSIHFKTYHYNQPLKSISSSLLCPHKSSMYFSPPRPRSITIMFTHGVSRQPFVEILILCLKEHIKVAQSIYYEMESSTNWDLCNCFSFLFFFFCFFQNIKQNRVISVKGLSQVSEHLGFRTPGCSPGSHFRAELPQTRF